MTRRILLALLALTAAVLAGAVIPLALQAVAHEREAFVNSVQDSTHSIAVISEDKLADHQPSSSLSRAVEIAARQDDELLVLNAARQPVVTHGRPLDKWTRLAAEAIRTGIQASTMTKNRAIAAEAVWSDGRAKGSLVGIVVLERPLGSLDQSITNLWLYLAVLATVALCAAALIAITFARWVNRPLARMDNAARRLADGNLAVRAATGSGPPELQRMATSFNVMAGRLETLVHGHRTMLADVSHQLRTPLAALRLRIDLLTADSAPAAATELAGAQEEIARLSRLVDGLLAIARAESVTEQVVSIDPIAGVAERVTAWQPVADSHGVKLIALHHDEHGSPVEHASPGQDGPPGQDGSPGQRGEPGRGGVPRIALGAGHLEQILDNLLANAIEAMPDGGTVTVTVADSGNGVTLTVADNGPGMPPEERSRAFLRFVSGSKAGGTGLGLAIMHRLVTSNGGTARLEETPGGGLTVVLEFPSTALYEGTNLTSVAAASRKYRGSLRFGNEEAADPVHPFPPGIATN
ncbi:MAG: HAMP domain-containing histidine kinase [Nocardiopsaceae bacterium]|nr:HAMP domain-containing histidine kinase [Nocardiopsaceae bacterium]